MKLAEIMTTPPITVQDDTSVDEVAARMIRHRIGCVPVVAATGECVGIVTACDFGAREDECPFPPFCAPAFPPRARRASGRAPDLALPAVRTARQIMTHRPITLEEGATVVEAIAKMLHLGFEHIPVVRDGVLVGIVARQDVLALTLRLLTDDPRTPGRGRSASLADVRPPGWSAAPRSRQRFS